MIGRREEDGEYLSYLLPSLGRLVSLSLAGQLSNGESTERRATGRARPLLNHALY